MTGSVAGDVTVAVLDGPVDAGHACFRGARLAFPLGQPEFDTGDPAARHGTHVASVLFGQPGSPVEGIAPAARGLVVPIFGAGGGKDGMGCTQLDLARAVAAALEAGADIINVSGGQLLAGCEPDADLAQAIAACERRGALLVAAAGNDGGDHAHVPACVFSVLAVGGADDEGRPLALSNRGRTYAFNGVLAAGLAIRGALPGGGTVERTGTSFAAPIASGAAAVLLMRRRRQDRHAQAFALRAVLAGKVIARNGAILPAPADRPDIQPEKRGNTTMQAEHPSSIPTTPPAAIAAELQEARASGQGEPGRHRPGADDAVLPSCAGKDCTYGEAKKDCGCGCGGARKAAVEAPPARIYALGQIGIDFGTESRRDSIAQFMRGKSPTDEKALIAYLANAGAEDVERLIWTVRLDNTPIYALQPVGAFAANGYARLLQAYKLQVERTVPLFAIPGRAAGSVRLMSGESVPLLVPLTRGLLAWDVADAVSDFISEFDRSLSRDADDDEKARHAEQVESMRGALPQLLEDFRSLVTRKYRNLGIAGSERALNYAATAAFRVYQVLVEVVKAGLVMDDIAVLKSPACRPGSDCYDVQLRLFVPADITAPLRVFQFTVDVSDTIPVHIGEVSIWSERPTR